MAQSTEYPDLRFVAPRAWGRGRDGKAVRYIVVHYTAGAERSTSAEDGAAYDQRRTDGTSTHYFVDSNSVVQCVRTTDRANAAMHRGNRLGIQYELCGTVQTRAQWLDPASDATLTNAARQIARDCARYQIPVRRLTVAETRAAWTQYPHGPKGIVGHVDCTRAYPEDSGNHTDPGPAFPWDVLLARVRHFIDGGSDDMALDPNQPHDNAAMYRLEALINLAPTVGGTAAAGQKVVLAEKIRRIEAIAEELAARPAGTVTLTPEDKAEIIAGLGPAVEAAIRKVLGGLDEVPGGG